LGVGLPGNLGRHEDRAPNSESRIGRTDARRHFGNDPPGKLQPLPTAERRATRSSTWDMTGRERIPSCHGPSSRRGLRRPHPSGRKIGGEQEETSGRVSWPLRSTGSAGRARSRNPSEFRGGFGDAPQRPAPARNPSNSLCADQASLEAVHDRRTGNERCATGATAASRHKRAFPDVAVNATVRPGAALVSRAATAGEPC
jgi:hypothetical protein